MDQKIPLLGHEGLYQATRAPIKPQGPLSGRKGFLLGHRCSLFGNYGQLFWAYIMIPIHYEGHHSPLSEYKGFMPNHKGLLPSHKHTRIKLFSSGNQMGYQVGFLYEINKEISRISPGFRDFQVTRLPRFKFYTGMEKSGTLDRILY